MNNKQNISNELKEVAPTLAKLPTGMPYTTPHTYFSHFPLNMLVKIKSTQPVQLVPEGYFENFADHMLDMVKKEDVSYELASISPFLQNIPKNNPYEIPEGYFENNKNLLAEKVTAKPMAKVVKLFDQKAKIRMAAAAVCIGLLFGSWWLFSPKASEPAEMATSEVFTKQLESINPNDMMVYLNDVDKASAAFAQTLFSAEESVENQLKDIKTDELIQYLQQENSIIPKS